MSDAITRCLAATSDVAAPFLLDTFVKATVLVAAAYLATTLIRPASAAVRHRIWGTTFVCLLLLPVLLALLPDWRFPIVPRLKSARPVVSVAPSQFQPAASRALEADASATAERFRERLSGADAPAPSPSDYRSPRASLAPPAAPELSEEATTPLAAASTVIRRPASKISWQSSVVVIWLVGVALALMPIAVGLARNRALGRGAEPAFDYERYPLFVELRRSLGIRRIVRLLETKESLVPMTWGILQPIVLVPRVWREWPLERQRIVLLHELAHVKRWDTACQVLSRLICAIYWFHPLVWYSLRRLRAEREMACDDRVLMAGERATNYAAHLLEIARDYSAAGMTAAVAMARPTSLEQRIRALLDQARSRLPISSAVGGTVLVCAAILLVAVATAGQARTTVPQTTAATDEQTDERPDAEASVADGESTEAQAGPAITLQVAMPALPEPTTFEEVAQSLNLHFETIRSAAFSSDGRLLAVAHGGHRTGGAVRIWDMQDKKEIASWEEPHGINSVHISPDGRFVAFSHLSDKPVTIGSIESGEEILEIATGNNQTRVRFSPDGKTLVTASTGGALKLWNVEDGKELKSLASLSFNLQCVAFSRDGTRIVAGGGPFRGDNFGWAGVWDVASGKQIAEMKDMPDSVLGIAISPDGNIVATAGRDGAARLWETETGKLASTLSGHQSALEWVDFSPDGKMLASGSYDDTAKLWSVDDGGEVATLPGHRGDVLTARFSPDGKTLATGGDGGVVRLWSVATREQTGVLEPDAIRLDPRSPVLSIACSPDGKTIASAHEDKTLRLRDAHTGKVRRVLGGHEAEVTCVAFSADSKTLATAGCDNTVRLWEVAGDREPATLTGHTDWVLAVAFAPDGKTVASSGSDKTVRLWDVETAKQTAVLEGHAQMVRCLAFSPDGKLLASGSTDATVRLWDVKSRSEAGTLEGRSGGALAFSPDGGTLATVGGDGAIILRDTATGNERRVPNRRSGAIWCLAFSPRGATLAGGVSDGAIVLWDPDSLATRASLRGHSDSVTSLAFTPDTGALISGSSDQTIKLWKSRQPPVPPLVALQAAEDGHSCRFVLFSPDGRLMVTGGDDTVIKVWDMQTGQPLRTLEGHNRGSSCGAFSPDGRLLATGTWGDVILLWDVASGDRIGELATGHDYALRVEFSPDGSRLAVATWSKTVSVCDVQSRQKLWASAEQSLAVTGVSFSPDGKTLVTTTGDKTKRELGGEAKLWDADSGKELALLSGHTDMVAPGLFSADGRLLFTGSADAMLRIWDVESRELRTTVSTPRAVQCLALLPDGRSVLSAHYGGRVSRWDTESGRFLAEYEGPAHTVTVFQVSCSPDGSLVATACTDGAIRLWPTLPAPAPVAATSAKSVRGWAVGAQGLKE